MATPTLLAATPVISARQWATVLAPRTGGGWKFVTQSYNTGEAVPAQWVLINIEEGEVEVVDGPNELYTNTNFMVASANTLITTTNQIRAANGRVFMPLRSNPGIGSDDVANVSYYDPADEEVHVLPSLVDPTGGRHDIVFQLVFDESGDTLYGGTQAVIGSSPMIFELDPDTLAMTYICNAGVAVSPAPKYAYYIAKDEGTGAQYLYVAVGQLPWEIVAIDLNTGTPTVLLTTVGPGSQFVEFELRAGLGWSANVISNGVQTRYWMADGALTPYPGDGAPPGGARDVTPYANPLVAPPEVDWSRGIGFFSWRPNGSSGDFIEITYEVDYIAPIDLESLATINDGTVVGNARQYNGFFEYSKITQSSEWFGNWPLGVSQPVLRAVSPTEVYICGYSNGALYVYDPTQEWEPDGSASGNPSYLGGYGTKIRYPYFLIDAHNDRLYACGREERDSLGSGVGYYDFGSESFVAVSTGLDDFIPRGFLVIEDEEIVVYSGKVLVGSGAPEAEIVTYDLDLNEVDRFVVEAGLQNTGILFPTDDPQIVVGLVNDAPLRVYRFNVVTGVLLQIENVPGTVVGGTTVRATDGYIYAEIDQELIRIDPETLEIETVVDLEVSTTYLSWLGGDLYMISGAELRYLPGGTNVANVFAQIPAPAANGSGAAVDVSTFGPVKTFTVARTTGGPQPFVIIEIANDAAATQWTPLCQFEGPDTQTLYVACRYVRATVANYKSGSAPLVNVASTDDGAFFATLVATAGDGEGASVDVSGLPPFKTVQVTGEFRGACNIEVSLDDGSSWTQILSFAVGASAASSVFVTDLMRVSRAGVPVVNPGTPIINIGATIIPR